MLSPPNFWRSASASTSATIASPTTPAAGTTVESMRSRSAWAGSLVSVLTERNGLVIASAGSRIGVVQIAGLVARRIVPFVRQGDTVAAGERIGLIRFGSRVDVFLPENVKPLVSLGQTAIAGETVIADLRAADASRAFRVS